MYFRQSFFALKPSPTGLILMLQLSKRHQSTQSKSATSLLGSHLYFSALQHKAGIPRRRHRHRHPREDPREDVDIGVGIVEFQLNWSSNFTLTFRSTDYIGSGGKRTFSSCGCVLRIATKVRFFHSKLISR